jgi:hypothetical protein
MPTSGVQGEVRCTINLTNVDGTSLAAAGATNPIQLPAGLTGLTITPGTGNGQCNEQWAGTLALASSTPQTLDLTALTGEFGRTVTFTRVKLLYVFNTTTSYTAFVTMGNAATNIFHPGYSGSTVTEPIYGGTTSVGLLKSFLGAGWTVSGSAKSLKFDPGATAQTIQVFIAGLK